jgi:hypothetical protein
LGHNHTATWSEAKEALASQFIELTYRVSEEILAYLQHVLSPERDNGKRLWTFLEIVAFVLFWIDLSGKKRAFGSNTVTWQHIVMLMHEEWERFFSDYPDGPILRPALGQNVGELLAKRDTEYEELYQSALKNTGALGAQNACSHRMLGHAWPQDEKGKLSEEIYEPAIHYLATVTQRLTRQVDVVIVSKPWDF